MGAASWRQQSSGGRRLLHRFDALKTNKGKKLHYVKTFSR